MVSAYDPRLTLNEQGKADFLNPEKLPVTVTEEITGNPDLMEARQQLLDQAYEKIFELSQQHGKLKYKASPEAMAAYHATARVVEEVDTGIRELLGEDITLKKFAYFSTDEIDIFAQELESQDPNSRVLPFLKAGIFPYHPEFNFLPTGERDDSGRAEGKFIELAIYNLQKFMSYVMASRDHKFKATTNRVVDRYVLYRTLDNLYTDIANVVFPRFIDFEKIHDPELQNALYHFCEIFRKSIQPDPDRYYNETSTIKRVENFLILAFDGAETITQLIERLAKLGERLANTGSL